MLLIEKREIVLEDLKQRCLSKGLIWVPGEGSSNAKLAICGEAPGAEEEGGSGKVLGWDLFHRRCNGARRKDNPLETAKGKP